MGGSGIVDFDIKQRKKRHWKKTRRKKFYIGIEPQIENKPSEINQGWNKPQSDSIRRAYSVRLKKEVDETWYCEKYFWQKFRCNFFGRFSCLTIYF